MADIERGVRFLGVVRDEVVKQLFPNYADTDIKDAIVAQYVLAYCVLQVTREPITVYQQET